jgi:Mg-chelatase subunit ChlD
MICAALWCSRLGCTVQARRLHHNSSLGLLLAAALAGLACDEGEPSRHQYPTPTARRARAESSSNEEIALPKADARLCSAVVLLIDTSGSMKQDVADRGGRRRAKSAIAADALNRIVEHTAEWRKQHKDYVLHLALFSFSSSVREVLAIGEFDADRAKAALARIPPPGGGTAIGRGIEEAARALYASGCVRKHLLCITDGENTSGPPPDRIARQLFNQTGGDIEMHFLAFDTSADQFAFLRDVNGHVVEAADGDQLQARLTEIYEKRILAEAMSAEQP